MFLSPSPRYLVKETYTRLFKKAIEFQDYKWCSIYTAHYGDGKLTSDHPKGFGFRGHRGHLEAKLLVETYRLTA